MPYSIRIPVGSAIITVSCSFRLPGIIPTLPATIRPLLPGILEHVDGSRCIAFGAGNSIDLGLQ